MSNDRRPGDFFESLTRAIALAFTIPIIAALISGLAMVLASILAIPFYIIFWVRPEEFLIKHLGLFTILWMAGVIMVVKILLPNSALSPSSECLKTIGSAMLFLVGAVGLVLVIAGGMAFLAHCDVEWARSALDQD